METQKLRAVVVYDEDLARSYICELLRAHPEIEVAAECANGFEAVKAVAECAPDLLLQRVIELRCRQEILQRWLASEVLTGGLQQSLRAMLCEVEEQLRGLSIVPGKFDDTLD